MVCSASGSSSGDSVWFGGTLHPRTKQCYRFSVVCCRCQQHLQVPWPPASATGVLLRPHCCRLHQQVDAGRLDKGQAVVCVAPYLVNFLRMFRVCFWKWFVSGLLPVCFRADLWGSQENSALCLQPLQCLQHTPSAGRGLPSFQLLESVTLHYQVQCCNALYNGLTGSWFYIIISK